MFIRRLIGEITFDMGPGDWISIVAGSWPGMVVAVYVACGVGVTVGSGVSVGGWFTREASDVAVAYRLAASAVIAMTVGR
jgi:hypothetical protein